jgi:GntR family transcriptional regulator
MQMYGVSRSTVRRAVQRLVDEGVLVRRQGKGTFVTRVVPKIVHSIDRLAPFMETFKQAGESLETTLIDFSWTEHPELPEKVTDWKLPVLGYQRRYVSAGIPHAVTFVYLPAHLGRRISRSDVEAMPVYDLLRRKLRIALSKAEFLVSARPPSKELSEALEVSPSTSLLVLERITRNERGEAVEATTHFLRPDVYQLSVDVNDLRRAA